MKSRDGIFNQVGRREFVDFFFKESYSIWMSLTFKLSSPMLRSCNDIKK